MHPTKWGSTAQRLIRWSLLLASIIGVTFLLLVFAGTFHRKVTREIASDGSEVFTLPAGSQTVSVKLKTYPRYESAVGTIQPIHRSEIASKILARVIELNVKAGQQISAGEVLVRLSDDELQARVQQVEADFEAATAQRKLAQIEAERAAQLISSRSISQSDFDAAQTRVQTTQAALDRARRSVEETKVYLSYATIVAPFSGIVIDKTVEMGDTVSPGQPVLTIYDPTRMQLVANVVSRWHSSCASANALPLGSKRLI